LLKPNIECAKRHQTNKHPKAELAIPQHFFLVLDRESVVLTVLRFVPLFALLDYFSKPTYYLLIVNKNKEIPIIYNPLRLVLRPVWRISMFYAL
jgi:hypothetical protein